MELVKIVTGIQTTLLKGLYDDVEAVSWKLKHYINKQGNIYIRLITLLLRCNATQVRFLVLGCNSHYTRVQNYDLACHWVHVCVCVVLSSTPTKYTHVLSVHTHVF